MNYAPHSFIRKVCLQFGKKKLSLAHSQTMKLSQGELFGILVKTKVSHIEWNKQQSKIRHWVVYRIERRTDGSEYIKDSLHSLALYLHFHEAYTQRTTRNSWGKIYYFLFERTGTLFSVSVVKGHWSGTVMRRRNPHTKSTSEWNNFCCAFLCFAWVMCVWNIFFLLLVESCHIPTHYLLHLLDRKWCSKKLFVSCRWWGLLGIIVCDNLVQFSVVNLSAWNTSVSIYLGCVYFPL